MDKDKCSWCKGEINPSTIDTSELEIRHLFTTYSDIFGCDSFGWKVRGMCVDCANKLHDKLQEMGVTIIHDYEAGLSLRSGWFPTMPELLGLENGDSKRKSGEDEYWEDE